MSRSMSKKGSKTKLKTKRRDNPRAKTQLRKAKSEMTSNSLRNQKLASEKRKTKKKTLSWQSAGRL